MNEEVDSDVVHEVGFGKGSGLAGEPADSLAQGAVEAFDVVGRPTRLTLLQLCCRHHATIGFPDVSKTACGFVSWWDAAPQHPASRHAPAAEGVSHNLPRAPTQSQPQPFLVFAFQDPCPDFIQFQFIPHFKRQQRFVER